MTDVMRRGGPGSVPAPSTRARDGCSMPWRLLLSPPLAGAENMALDDVLRLRARDTGEAVLRVYTWRRPTLSLGRNQRALAAYSADRARALGVDVVRRPTGGRAVLHAREVTYSVTAPERVGEPLAVAYGRVNALLLDALRRLGVDAALARPVGPAPIPSAAPCFVAPVAGELVVAGRKLVGSAQYREGGALMQHGSILVDDDQALLAALALVPLPTVPPPATLRGALGRAPDVVQVAAALFAAVRAREDAAASPLADIACTGELDLTLSPSLRAAMRGALVHYRDPAWTWRR